MAEGPVAIVSAATVQLYIVYGLKDVTEIDVIVDVRMCVSPVCMATRVTS